jgi:hypothetical protein
MHDWAKVVVQPLGLAGFALFLVFGSIARAKSGDQRRWLAPVAVAMACFALIGGLALAYLSTAAAPPSKSAAAPAGQPAAPQLPSIQTTGSDSPVFVGTGAVNFTADQSSTGGKSAPKKTSGPAGSLKATSSPAPNAEGGQKP